MERETGIEPATNSLEGCDSTTEFLPPIPPHHARVLFRIRLPLLLPAMLDPRLACEQRQQQQRYGPYFFIAQRRQRQDRQRCKSQHCDRKLAHKLILVDRGGFEP